MPVLLPSALGDLVLALRSELFYDFLAAALMTVGLIGLAVASMRRVRDLTLTYLAVSALIYGFRLGMDRELIHVLFRGVRFIAPLRAVMDLLLPLAIVLFFKKLNFLKGAAVFAGYGLVLVQGVLLCINLLWGKLIRRKRLTILR